MDELQAVTRFATEYGIDFGVEHSVRFCAGEWFPQRQLLSFHAGDFSQAALGELLSALSLNDPSALLRFFPGSEYVHFAAEACASVTICKCYLELDTANASPNAECIRFLGWKWATGPTADSGHVLTQYRQQPVRSWQSVVDQIDTIADLPSSVADMLHICRGKFPERLPQLLQVTESGSVRHSWDVNVYDSVVSLQEITPLLHALCDTWKIPVSSVGDFLQPRQHALVGHLAAGIHRSGRPFLTVYFREPPTVNL